jgi:hypothetical protein
LAAKQADDLEECDINIHETKAGYETFKRRFIPDRFDIGVNSLEIVECPGVEPRDNNQKQTDFEGEDRKTEGQQAALPAIPGNGRGFDRYGVVGKRAAWGHLFRKKLALFRIA